VPAPPTTAASAEPPGRAGDGEVNPNDDLGDKATDATTRPTNPNPTQLGRPILRTLVEGTLLGGIDSLGTHRRAGPGAAVPQHCPHEIYGEGHTAQVGHSHDDVRTSWAGELGRYGVVAIRALLGVLAVLTAIGVVWLWPDGSGRDAAVEAAGQVGLASERLEAAVDTVTDSPCSYATGDETRICRTIVAIPSEGPDAGALVDLGEFELGQLAVPDLAPGDDIILGYEPSTNFYFYADRDRRLPLLALAGVFAAVVITLGRLRGAMALVAMALTLVVLVAFVAPSVLDGHDPVLVAVVAASAIAFTTLYLTHGLNPTTTVALIGTLTALGLTLAVSAAFFAVAHFSGLATEEGLTLPILSEKLNLASLLLGGAIIGALGALDDVTVTQAATVAELRHRNPGLKRRQLVTSGIRVGREHIASTVNTLLLAYAGASMPLLLLFAATNQSLDMVANSELVAVEIARTLCGSIGLVAAVPLTTVLAASLLSGPPSDAAAPEDDVVEERAPEWSDFAPADDLDL